jgi:FixJ family two-component response regulator
VTLRIIFGSLKVHIMSSTVSFDAECILERGTGRFDAIFPTDPEADRRCKPVSDSPLISIVDDDSLVLRSLARLIKATGFRVVTFGSAEEFLESGKAWEVACVILDIGLPGMSGLDLQAKLAAQNCQVPIVFVTAHGEDENRARAVRNGAVAFLPKPLNDEALVDAIRSALNRD